MSLKHFLERIVLREQPVAQPTPDVTSRDVDRVVHRDFQKEQIAEVLAALDKFDSGRAPSPRVHLAALKLADGSVEKLRGCLEVATSDYRDVLVPAEYPEFARIGHRSLKKMSIKERNRVIESDWRQYEEWLQK